MTKGRIQMDLMSLEELSREHKVQLLDVLGYSCDDEFIYQSNGDIVTDKYTEDPVLIDSMMIFPGSSIILDDNPLSLAAYIEEYGDIFD